MSLFPALGAEFFSAINIYVRIYRFIYTFTNLNTLANLSTHLEIILHIHKSDYTHTD